MTISAHKRLAAHLRRHRDRAVSISPARACVAMWHRTGCEKLCGLQARSSSAKVRAAPALCSLTKYALGWQRLANRKLEHSRTCHCLSQDGSPNIDASFGPGLDFSREITCVMYKLDVSNNNTNNGTVNPSCRAAAGAEASAPMMYLVLSRAAHAAFTTPRTSPVLEIHPVQANASQAAFLLRRYPDMLT